MKNSKGLIKFTLVICIFFCLSGKIFAEELGVTAQAAVVLDFETGSILYAKNHLEPRPPASTTKTLTAILAIEQGQLNDIVPISSRAAETGEASINLLAGESMSIENLLYGALLKSGNDACVALAEAITPTVEEFVELMNLKAKILGCQETNFINTNGLPNKNHYASALDLAVIARYALNNPVFQQIVATEEKTIHWVGSSRQKYIQNTNKLLEIYPGAIGVKTGTTDLAGKCLIAAANKEGRILIAVVLKSQDRFGDAIRLLDYGFNNYFNQVLIKKGQRINVSFKTQNLIVTTKDSFVLTLNKQEQTRMTYKIKLEPKKLKQKIVNDQPVGNLKIYNYHRELAILDIYATE